MAVSSVVWDEESDEVSVTVSVPWDWGSVDVGCLGATIHLLKAPTLSIWSRWDCRYHRIPVMALY